MSDSLFSRFHLSIGKDASQVPSRRTSARERGELRSGCRSVALQRASASQIPPRRRCHHSHGDTAGPRDYRCKDRTVTATAEGNSLAARPSCGAPRAAVKPDSRCPLALLPPESRKRSLPPPSGGPGEARSGASGAPLSPSAHALPPRACVVAVPLRGAFVAAGAGGARAGGRLRSRRGSRPIPSPPHLPREAKKEQWRRASRASSARPGPAAAALPAPCRAQRARASPQAAAGAERGPGGRRRGRRFSSSSSPPSAMATELEPPAAGAVSGGAPLEAEEDEEHWLYGGTGRRGRARGRGWARAAGRAGGAARRPHGVRVCAGGWGGSRASPGSVQPRPCRDSLSPRRPRTPPSCAAPRFLSPDVGRAAQNPAAAVSAPHSACLWASVLRLWVRALKSVPAARLLRAAPDGRVGLGCFWLVVGCFFGSAICS